MGENRGNATQKNPSHSSMQSKLEHNGPILQHSAGALGCRLCCCVICAATGRLRRSLQQAKEGGKQH